MLTRVLAPILAVAVLFFAGCGKGGVSAEKPAAKEEARVVRLAVATQKEVERTLSATGVLAARDQAVLSAKVAGRVEEISVDVGSVVKQGDVIGQIQKRDYELRALQSRAAAAAARARLGLPLEGTNDAIDVKDSSIVREARAQLEEQAKNRERSGLLAKQGILSEAESETAEAAYQVAVNQYEEATQEANNRRAVLAQRRAELNIAEQQLADAVVRAPFDGVVQERRASAGEYLMEGAPLATLVRVDPIRLRLEVSERESMAVQRGQRVRFRVDGDTNVYLGKIERLSPVITQDNRMFQIEADVANDGRLRPGAFARADILINEKAPAITIPRNAVAMFAGVEKVFLVESGKAVERRVTTGAVHGTEIEISKGLQAGEAVILDPGSMRAEQPVVVGGESTLRADDSHSG